MRRASLLTPVALVALGLVDGIAAARQADPPPRAPNVWAIVIGIDNYDDAMIPDGRGAARDALAIARWFRETARWGERHALLLTDRGASRPGDPDVEVGPLLATKANLTWATTEWLKPRVQPGDLLVVSFAGQAAGKDGREYLLPIDARATAVDTSGWPVDEALDTLAAQGQNRILYWLDTSLHGRGRPVPQPPVDNPKAQEPATAAHWLGALARWPGVVAWLAADGRPADEGAGAAHSPFAAALLEGLGTPAQPRSLTSCLGRLHRHGPLAEQGFRTLGGIPPDLSLWPQSVLPRAALLPELVLQRGHAAGVSAVALTADGSQMITAGLDSTVRIWRVADRTLLRVLTYHRQGATTLALSPDGRWVASGDNYGRVRVWDLVEHREKPLQRPQPHQARIERLVALPDGGRFVSLDRDGTTFLWDASGPVLRFAPLTPAGTPPSLRIAGASEPGGAAVAAAGIDDRVRLFDAAGQPGAVVAGPGGAVTAIDLAPDGRLLAVGDDRGQVEVWEIGPGDPKRIHQARSPVQGEVGALRLSRTRRLAIGVGKSLLTVVVDKPRPWAALPGFEGPVGALDFSPDGRALAASTVEEPGRLLAWRWDDEAAPPRALRLRSGDGDGVPTGALSLAFAADGRSLVVGGGDGDIRAWDLPAGDPRPGIPHHRGQVARLAVSADGRFLLQISSPDGAAQVWDFQEGRGAVPVRGWWDSGAFLRDGETLVLTADPDVPARPGFSFKGGDVVLVDRASGRPLPVTFRRPPGAQAISFGPVAVSADGRKIAAASREGQVALVCVWEAPADREKNQALDPVHAIRGHADSLTAIGFSADGRRLLTAGIDGEARVWDVSAGAQDPPEVGAFRVPAGGEDAAITAAQLDPTDPARVVVGSRAGRVLLWQPGAGGPDDLGLMDGEVRAVAFSADGKWLMAGGEDRMLRLWTLNPAPQQVELDPADQHVERVNALVAWPNRPQLVSGGDDTTARLWSLADRKLLGIFSAVPPPFERVEPAPEVKDPGQVPRLAADWVVYTPSGQFDASHEGERQVKWRREREVQPLEQYYEQYHVFRLADQLRQGVRPEPPGAAADPPAVALDAPARPVAVGRDIELTVTLGDPGLQDVRLYQNGQPVRGFNTFRPRPDNPRKLTVPVQLRKGDNVFYAMAGRRNALDGRSQEIRVRYDGPEQPPKLHLVAIGISAYQRRALRYAAVDAESIARFFGRPGLAGPAVPGSQFVLTEGDVSEAKVDEIFDKIKKDSNPEDTILVFLAGHTGVVKQQVKEGLADVVQERFHLLLKDFPFPEGDPLQVAARDAVIRVRGAGPGQAIDPQNVLSFVAVYRNLSNINPLQRLVIVDACQAATVRDDAGVQIIRRRQEQMEKEARQARTAYLLAARRGELAVEAVPLEHGLLTYSLLRGLGAPGLIKTVPEVEAVFRDPASADLDADRIVTSLELSRFVDLTLPGLSAHFPALVTRGEGADRPAPAAVAQSLRVLDQRASFPLVGLPAGP